MRGIGCAALLSWLFDESSARARSKRSAILLRGVGRCLFASCCLVACGAELSRPGDNGPRGGSAGQASGGAGMAGVGGLAAGGTAGGAGSAGAGGQAGTGGAGGLGGAGASAGSAGIGGMGGGTGLEFLGAATFRHDAKGAYTLIHDDTCDPAANGQIEHGDVELTARGLHAAFGAIVKQCQDTNSWDALARLLEHGHEVLSHSWSHANIPTSDRAIEIDQARQVLEENVSGLKVNFFIFPEDLFDDPSVEHLKAAGYLGARAGIRGWNLGDFPDSFRVNWDVYGPGFSFYVKEKLPGPCTGVAEVAPRDTVPIECRQYVMRDFVDQAMAGGKWAVRELHGVADNSWESIPLDEYTQHLDYLKQQVDAGALWMDTPSAMIRYRRSRELCPTTFQSNQLDFTGPSAECLDIAVPLTFRFQVASGSSLSATQDGTALETLDRGSGLFVVLDADPARGAVTLKLR